MTDNFLKLDFISKIHDFVRTKVADGIQNTPKFVPGHVSKILPNDFIEFTIDATGPYTLPKLQVPQMFSKYHREPTQVGDKGIVVAGSYFIGGSSGQDGSTANLYPKGNLTTGSFQPVSNKNFPKRDPNMFLVTGGTSGHTTQSEDTKTSTVIDKDNNINHTSSNAINHTAQKDITHASMTGNINLVQKELTIGAPSSSTQDPPIPSLPTAINLIGSLAASGIISSSSGGATGSGGTLGTPIPAQLINAPVTVTGSRGGNAALTSLLTALHTLGLITNNTTT
jgi:hypothetical protein